MEPPSPSEPTLPPPDEDLEATTAATHAAAPTVAPAPVSRHFHHYEVCLREDGTTLWELGRGAMGVSYKARDVNLDTFVAVKVIRAGLPGAVQARERFRREARAAAQLRHPNVASVFHFGETPAGECFYAMEFIEGETLADRVRRDGPLPVALVIEIAMQVTEALVAADERGLVHRDLKPANLMLAAPSAGRSPTRPGSAATGSSASAFRHVTVKVIDFGLAKAVAVAGADGAGREQPLTQFGGFFGTPAYASPEQAEGGEVDARSDIYSLGVTLWYLLTGRVPFAGRSLHEVHDRQLHRPLPVAQLADAAGLPASFKELLQSMLAAHAADRPASPGELLEALERCRDDLGANGPPDPRPLPGGVGDRRRDHRPGADSRRRVGIVVAALLVLLTAGAGAFGYFHFFRPEPSTPTPEDAAPDKSIAVLPLEDLSEDKSNLFFADGIQDDLLGSLARIKELKVISRSSVMGYRDTASRNLRTIGRQLGVAHILEGSVRRAPDRVLVNVALIDARTGRQVWVERYDRTLADSLTLQGELATEIAAALHATLSPEERTRVEAKPTGNADAYVLYLRARDYHTRPTGLLQDYQAADRLYSQALALDPNFALAHARRATCLAYLYNNFQPTAEVHDRARAEADAALRLRPDAGESHLALGLCLYWTEKNYEAGLRELEIAARLLPGNAEVDFFSGAIRRRQGRWTQALDNMKRASARDPRNLLMAREILLTETLLRDWPAAARDGERAVALAPDLPLLAVEKSYVAIWSRRDLAPLNAVLAAVPPGVDPDGEVTLARWDAALLARDYDAAERAVTTGGAETGVTPFGAVLTKDYLLGCVALARGDAARAQARFEAARPAMETEARNVPRDAFRQAQLGVLYAYLGRKEDALRQGRAAVALIPEARDAYFGPCLSGMLALIHARVGEPDEALALIERLLGIPGPLSQVFDGSITQSDLRLRWQWDPLRRDPRFEKLLAGPEPKTVY